ncbi:MAG: sugar phosphate isomerase/epimerase family protein [Armatimonadota bacterium]
MELCGHTMGMPDKSVFDAIKFCAQIGLDAIEIRCAANGHLDPETVDLERLNLIADAAAKAGVKIACLTPYYKDYSTPEAAEVTLEGMRKTCRCAEVLKCGLVRATGGQWPMGAADRKHIWAATAVGLQQASDIAIEHGVKLALENHSGTLTQTAEDTVGMVLQVARPNFGILMDHYWVVAAAKEDPLEAVRLQAPYVLHCHCKGLQWQPDGKPLATFLDEGVIDWLPILRILKEHGYEGYLSDEYEKFWRPELPEPEVGMVRNAEYLRGVLQELS